IDQIGEPVMFRGRPPAKEKDGAPLARLDTQRGISNSRSVRGALNAGHFIPAPVMDFRSEKSNFPDSEHVGVENQKRAAPSPVQQNNEGDNADEPKRTQK